jgi:uncharacterized protein YutE (UPF0331/DUF86 family)
MNRSQLREDIIRIKIMEIRECVNLVMENLPDSLDEFLQLGLIKDGIYKRMEFAIEDVFDICAILNTDLTLGIPEGDDDILDHLAGAGVITPQILGKIRHMRGFRNIVVHRYGKIDDRLVYTLLNEHLGDFSEFIEEIEILLRAHQAKFL